MSTIAMNTLFISPSNDFEKNRQDKRRKKTEGSKQQRTQCQLYNERWVNHGIKQITS